MAEFLRMIRQREGLSLRAMADYAMVSHETWANYEKAKNDIPFVRILKLVELGATNFREVGQHFKVPAESN